MSDPMNLIRFFLLGLLATLAVTDSAAQAPAFTSGTYAIADGTYSIQVASNDANLTVVEPNKTSVYAPAEPGAYHIHHPRTGSPTASA